MALPLVDAAGESEHIDLEDFKLDVEAELYNLRDQQVAELEVRISERVRELVANTNKLWRAVVSRASWKVYLVFFKLLLAVWMF